MIITEPAATIISDTFNFGVANSVRGRLKGRHRRVANPFSSQAYAEAGLIPATKPSGAGAPATRSATERRRSPQR
jgi:hypothetical protein